MIVVNQLGDKIIVSFKNEEYNVVYSEDKFKALMEIGDKSLRVKTLDELDVLMKQVEGICENNFKEKIEAFHPEVYVQPITKAFYLKLDGLISSVEIPDILVRRMEESVEKGISIDPLVKAWKRFLCNPKMIGNASKEVKAVFAGRFAEYVDLIHIRPDEVKRLMEEEGLSEELAEEQAATFEVKITKEGLLACYKISNEVEWKYEQNEAGEIKRVDRYKKSFDPDTGKITGDNRDDLAAEDRLFLPAMQGESGDEFFCEGLDGTGKAGHFIKVGCVHRLADWSMVDTRDDVGCVKGLHVGGLSYITGWSGEIHTCFVDPMHIGAIPLYYDSLAIRVLEYYVYGSLTALNHSIYHSSEYGAKTDKQWGKIQQDIIASYGELMEESNKEADEIAAL